MRAARGEENLRSPSDVMAFKFESNRFGVTVAFVVAVLIVAASLVGVSLKKLKSTGGLNERVQKKPERLPTFL